MWRKVRDGPGGVNGIFSRLASRPLAAGFAFPGLPPHKRAAAMNRPSKIRLSVIAILACAFAGYFALPKFLDHKNAPSELPGWRTRQLAGLTLEAPGDFQTTPLNLGPAQEFVESSEMHVCKTAAIEIDVLRTVYKGGIELNFDGAAQGAVDGLARLDGIRNVQHTATEQTVSGKPARRLSITAERFRKPVRVESILISDGQAYYQVQAIFDSTNPSAPADAERLLQSVHLAP
jgi:hypothetical protein